MPNRGAVAATDQELDVTTEILLIGENEVSPQGDARKRRRKFTLIAVTVVVLLGAAIGLTFGLSGGSSAAESK
jgi:hypothetical protein